MRFVLRVDLLHCRVPTPAAIVRVRVRRVCRTPGVRARRRRPAGAAADDAVSRREAGAVARVHARSKSVNMQWMANHALTFANGAALGGEALAAWPQVDPDADDDDRRRSDRIARGHLCASAVRLLTVSRIDPRKGLRVLPEVVRLLIAGGCDVTLDIVGPVVGEPGKTERAAIDALARDRGVADRVSLAGPVPLDRLLPLYRDYDVFVLPTLPGEGIPRVLLEAMAAGCRS